MSRRSQRQEARRQRRGARKKVIKLAAELYEDGDDVESLSEKVTIAAESSIGDRPFLKLLLSLLEKLLPLFLRMMA